MKFFILTTLLFTALLGLNSHACQAGDRSKTLLVLAEAYGEENAVIAEIDQSGHASILRDGYMLAKENATSVQIKDLESSHIYKFPLNEAEFRGSFCYPVIMGH